MVKEITSQSVSNRRPDCIQSSKFYSLNILIFPNSNYSNWELSIWERIVHAGFWFGLSSLIQRR